MYRSEAEVAKRVLEHADFVRERKHNFFFVALQGSWNYDLGYEGSDVDTKALLIPTFKDIVLNRQPISTTAILPNNEHCDFKDARLMFQNFWKQNVNFLEIMFTPWVAVNENFTNEYYQLKSLAEDIAHYDIKKALNSMCGMAHEKYFALERPYPTLIEKIEKFGYDGKQLSHIMRMEDFSDAYMAGKTFKECLVSFDAFSQEELMKAKRNEYSLEEARYIAKTTCERIKDKKDFFLNHHECNTNENVKVAAEEVLYSVFERQFCLELSH